MVPVDSAWVCISRACRIQQQSSVLSILQVYTDMMAHQDLSLPHVIEFALAISAIPPIRDAAAVACSRARVQWATSLPSPSPPLPVFVHPTPIPMAHGHSLKGEYSDGDGTTRTDARASVLRDDPNATEERQLRRGRYGRRK
ncbi:hypothetical protein B0H14DRAFT_3454957 [Mycena olivaceomarginata]|nr:hypothetical protein B0H14DRAFT_3454957 [Mycena olivaceomarginata]